MKKKIIAIILIFAVIFVAAVSCGQKDTDKETDPAETPVDKTACIGDPEAADDNTYVVELTNATGQDITRFTIRDHTQLSYPGNMLPYGQVYGNSEMRVLYYTPEEPDENASPETLGDEQEVSLSVEDFSDSRYDAVVTLDNGSREILHGFPLDDMERATISMEDDILYITYISLKTGKEISTLDIEKLNEDTDTEEEQMIEESEEEDQEKTDETDDKNKKDSSEKNKENNNTNESGSDSGGTSGSDSGSSGSGNDSVNNSGIVDDEDLPGQQEDEIIS